MQVDTEVHEKAPVQRNKLPVIIAAVVLVVVGVGIFMVQEKEPSPETLITDSASSAEPAVPPPMPPLVDEAPDIPEAVAPLPEDLVEEEALLPTLAESDDFTRDILTTLNGSEDYALWLQTENLIQKAVTFTDGVSRGNILRKVLPINPPAGKFAVQKEDDRIYLDRANYERYDSLVNLVTGISVDAAYDAFHRLRPLLEAGFEELGYSGDKMDNSLIAAIDQVLSAPEISTPIALKSESVAYTFADPNLEKLPAVHKQMIRMGPENTRKIKALLAQIKERLLAED